MQDRQAAICSTDQSHVTTLDPSILSHGPYDEPLLPEFDYTLQARTARESTTGRWQTLDCVRGEASKGERSDWKWLDADTELTNSGYNVAEWTQDRLLTQTIAEYEKSEQYAVQTAEWWRQASEKANQKAMLLSWYQQQTTVASSTSQSQDFHGHGLLPSCGPQPWMGLKSSPTQRLTYNLHDLAS